MKILSKITLLLAILSFPVAAFAQEVITGKVTDLGNEP